MVDESILKAVCEKTGTNAGDWELMPGRVSGVGTEFWFYNTKSGQDAYVQSLDGEIWMDVQKKLR